MLTAIISIISIIWFCQTSIYQSWKGVIIGGTQLSISLSVLIILAYLFIAVLSLVRWYYSRRMY